jgi:simple sugar transport system permease protein
LASVIGGLVIQATTTSMYAVNVSANSVIAIKALVVIFVILLYSEQVRGLIRRITGQKEAASS